MPDGLSPDGPLRASAASVVKSVGVDGSVGQDAGVQSRISPLTKSCVAVCALETLGRPNIAATAPTTNTPTTNILIARFLPAESSA